MSDRRVPPGGGIVLAIVLSLMMWASFFALATAQEPEQQFLVAVDTAGVTPIAPNVYTTWIFALSSPTSLPSSGILVAFDCANEKVRRLAQVKYTWNADSSGVSGPVVEVNGPWVAVTDLRMFRLVCSIGPTHVVEKEPPASQSPWFAPGKPRTNA